ncbi:MAG: F0F1 ATP synthase subunit B [Halocynthiibacter sp.]
MKKILIASGLMATPAMAASGPFLSLANTNFVVLLAFILFIAILWKFGVHSMIGSMLDKRADDIKAELDEAKALHEEAKEILASYERKQKEVAEQAERIVEAAKAEAANAADAAKADLATSIERRLAAATDQIASAEAQAVKEVRDQAASVAVLAAGDLISKGMTAAEGNKLIDAAIAEVEAKLH